MIFVTFIGLMKSVVLTGILLLTAGFCSEAQTGFFLVVNTRENCPHLVKTVDYKNEYCIPNDPIISGHEFRVEGNPQYDLSRENQFLVLRLSDEGLETLKLICANFPEKQLVLVVNGRAAGFYENKDFKPAQRMSVWGKADSREFNWIYENLKNNNQTTH